MDTSVLIDAVEDNGELLLAAAGTNLDASVAACPGWDLAALVTHVGQVHGWVAGVVNANSADQPSHGFPEAPARDDVLAWQSERLDELLAALRSHDPADPAWTWGAEKNVGWFARRMAHETLVHRLDAELAVGHRTAIDSDLASDGVDELIEVGLQRSSNPNKEFSYPAGSLHLHRTDGEGEWLLRVDDGALVVTREHAKGDVAVRGSGPALLSYLWGRGADDVEVFGDADLAEAWSRVAP